MGAVRMAHEFCRLLLMVAVCYSLSVLVPAGGRLLWNAAELVETLNAGVKVNEHDVRAAVHSAAVIAARTEDTAAEVHGIAASVDRMAWKASQPESRGQKVVEGLKLGALVLSRFVP